MPATAIHEPIQQMSAAQGAAFPDADYVIAVRLPRDQGAPSKDGAIVFTAYAQSHLAIAPELHLEGRPVVNAGDTPLKLMPGDNEIMQTFMPDTTASICTNRPVWKWVGLTVTDIP